MTAAGRRPPGRPSVAEQRRTRILDAFIDLVGRHGLESVTLDGVAREAGVQRPLVRHFVGNRGDLVRGAVERLADLYAEDLRAAVGAAPGVDALLDLLFGPGWTADLGARDRAFDALLLEASRDPRASAAMRRAYDALLDEVADALRRDAPTAAPAEVRDAAYAIVCLAEHNATMTAIGYPRQWSAAARDAAAHVVRRLTAGAGTGEPATGDAATGLEPRGAT